MQLNHEVRQRSLKAPASIAQASLPVVGVAWRRTIVCGDDAQDFAHQVAIASADDVTKIQTFASGEMDFPFYLKREANIVFPSGSVELLGVVCSPDMLEDEYDLYLELDGHHITPTFIGRLLATLGGIPAVVAADWRLLNQYATPAVCEEYAKRHGWPHSSARTGSRFNPRNQGRQSVWSSGELKKKHFGSYRDNHS